jgi:hypothetical protein
MLDALESLVIKPVGAFWFVYTLIAIEFVLLVSKHLLRNFEVLHNVYWVPAVLIVATVCTLGILQEWAVTYFLLGVLLAAGGFPLIGSMLFGILGAAISIALSRFQPMPFSILHVAWCISLTTILYGVCKLVPRFIKNLFVWFGRNTLIVPFLHAAFIVALKPLAPLVLRIEPTGLFYSILTAALAMGGCLASSALLDQLGLSPFLFGKQRIYMPLPS